MSENKEQPSAAKTVQAPLADFQVVLSEVKHCAFNAPSEDEGFALEVQPVMIDFEIIKSDKRPSNLFVSLVLELENNTQASNRLSFSISTITAFEFRPNGKATNLPENEEKYKYLLGDAVSVAISLARGYLTNYLAPTRYRGYILPVIDIGHLLQKKSIKKLLPKVPNAFSPKEQPRSEGAK